MQNVAPVSQDKIQNLVDYIKLEDVKPSSDCQPRESINTDTVSEYAEQMAEGADFPPITVFNDGETNWLADGFHRYHAANEADLTEIKATIHTGTKRDAILYSCGANARHGLRRTNEDKRRAVLALLHDDEWTLWSDREIARRCDVSHDLVNRARKSILSLNDSIEVPKERTFIHPKTGKPTKMDTSKVGRSNVVEVAFGSDEQDEPIDPADYLETNPLEFALSEALLVLQRDAALSPREIVQGADERELREIKGSVKCVTYHLNLLNEEIAKCV